MKISEHAKELIENLLGWSTAPHEGEREYDGSGRCIGGFAYADMAQSKLEDYIATLEAEVEALKAEHRWIPVSEPPKECEMRVFKDGNAWCFVLPDFQDLQVSSSVWMKEGVLDKIYNDLGLVEEREE